MTGRTLPDELCNPIRFRVGHALEPLAGELYEEHTRREVFPMDQNTIQVHPVFPYLTCTLDFTVVDYAKGKGCLNVKTANVQKAEDWQEGCPKDYWVQAQHECYVTGRKWAGLGVIIGNNAFRYIDIDRDDTFIDTVMLPCAHRFWACVQTDAPPEIDGSDATTDALNLAFSESDGEVIELPIDPFLEADECRENWLRHRDTADDHCAYHTNQIKQYMGTAENAILPGVCRYSWKTQRTSNGGTARVFRRHAL
jgi:predicted phage-related endonuclease